MLSKNLKISSKKVLWPSIILGALLLCALVFAFWFNSAVKKPNSNDASKVEFKIESGEGGGDIAERLQKEKLIKSSFAFVFYLNLKRVGNSLQVGEYDIPRNLNIEQVTEILTKGKIQSSKITIPEGWDVRKIAEYLANKKIVERDAFLAQARVENYRANYNFLKTLPDGATLEGFLYPDTYQLSRNAGPDEIIRKMLDNFEKKIGSEESKIAGSNMTLYEIVNLASVVEREVAKADDRKLVASVFLNRLEIGMPLESCATIQYILRENKKQFTYEETRTLSPYNTYLNRGLPAGPIGNPSIDSLKAVISPQDSNYLYFLSSEGVTYFSKTLNEHNEKKARYLN